MIEVFFVLFICTTLAYLYNASSPIISNNISEKNKDNSFSIKRKENFSSKVITVILIFYMVWFAGLRTVMNDTAQYIRSFNSRVPSSISQGIKDLDLSIGANPLFELYRLLLKNLVSKSGNTFIFISSAITIILMVSFIRKYTINFGYSLFVFVAFSVYAFTMAAMKQTMATSIAVWAIPYILEKKYIKASALIIIAMLIHPYVVIFFAAFFLVDEIWGKKTVLLILATIVTGMFFSVIIDALIGVTENIGDNYQKEYFEVGVSFFRRLVYFVVPILSFVYRDKLRKENNKLCNLVINLSIVSALIMFLAGFGGSVLIARLANYFDIFTCLALPIVLFKGIENKSIRSMIYILSFPSYVFFYYTYYSKYISHGTHFYDRITLIELFNKW